jgi:Flp pilus assembly pilin Flp
MYKTEFPASLLRHKKVIAANGFATIEYCVLCGLVAIVLFANPNSAIELVEAIKAFYRALTFFISLP